MSKPSNPFILGLKLLGIQIMMILVSVFFLGSFSRFVDSNLGMKIYSSCTALFFLSTYYSSIWQAGKRDAKHVKVYNKFNESKIKIRYSNLIIAVLIALIPNIIALTALYITGTHSIFNSVYRIWQSSFLGWLGDDNLTYLPNCVIVTFIPALLSFPAYFAGTKEFVIIEKYLPMLIYNKKSGDKKKK